MILTDSPFISSGYGSVMYNLIKRWTGSSEFEFIFIGNSSERQHERKLGEGTYTALPRFSDFGYDVLGQYLDKFKPDILLTLYDVGYQSGFIEIINKAHQIGWRGKWIAYLPIDTETKNVFTWEEVLSYMDVHVAMSKHGKKYFKKNYGIDAEYIPHGVDLNTFKPRDMKHTAGIDEDTFVVGAVGKNQIRKMWFVLFKAFEKFQKDKNDVKLLLHTDVEPSSVQSGWSLKYYANKHGFDISTTTANLSHVERQFIDNDIMANIYNSMDLYAFPTGGEGFGLPTLEAMACGIPVTTKDYTTGKELCGDAGFKIIPILKDKYGRNVMWPGLNGVEFAIADDKVLAENMEYYYKKWKEGEYGEEKYKAVQHAKKYNYDKIAKDWIKLFKRVL